ncbi:hypothetical protein A3H19_01860 [Candidatus Woesebacteria bacterium RIFCSPLOWO2_12_FULL_39_9]|nr:MAG: hypothetical protein A3H19_01860 [Candidatus Woesebacteria bacterium RIFCSPLOWO2_12_FULL_39_9]
MLRTFFIIISLFIYLNHAKISLATDRVVSNSAQIKKDYFDTRVDQRVVRLESFLESHNSPLASYAFEFVWYADLYDIDWRLVPAISGVESTFGKKIPRGSYNAYGWVNGKYRFESWESSIEIVSKTLREKYYDRGATSISQIARRYAPPSKTWAWKVRFFMEKIDSTPVEFDL